MIVKILQDKTFTNSTLANLVAYIIAGSGFSGLVRGPDFNADIRLWDSALFDRYDALYQSLRGSISVQVYKK